LLKFIKMKEPGILTSTPTSIIYGKKDFNPFIVESKNEHNTDIMLITLNIGKRMLVNISKQFICLLENYSLEGELTIIASINKKDNPLEIKLYDKYTKSDIDYTFTIIEDSLISTDVDKSNGDEIEITNKINRLLFSKKIVESKNGDKYTPYIISNYRPNRPTHTILSMRSEVSILKSLHQKYSNTNAFNIVEFNNVELQYVIEELKAQRFNAVTLFVNSEYYNNRVKRTYSNALSQLEHHFKVFFIMLNNGQIIKQKY